MGVDSFIRGGGRRASETEWKRETGEGEGAQTVMRGRETDQKSEKKSVRERKRVRADRRETERERKLESEKDEKE